jgi:hypothetical protein
MTRKDYRLIAQCVAMASDKSTIIANLCVMLKTQNPRFDTERFTKASNSQCMYPVR